MESSIDKSKELRTSIRLINNKLHFEGVVEGNSKISIDYTFPLGDDLGYTSLELFLLSLSSCVGSSVLVFLRKMQKNIEGFEIIAEGLRREEHPTCFKKVNLIMNLKSSNTTPEEVEKVIKLAEETYCPVLAMVKGNVEVFIEYTISQ